MSAERVTFVIQAENGADVLARVALLFHHLNVEIDALYMVRRPGSVEHATTSAQVHVLSCSSRYGGVLHCRGGTRCSCDAAQLVQETLHPLPEGVRAGTGLARRASLEFPMDQEFQVSPGEQTLALAAVEKVPQQGDPLNRFGPAADVRRFRKNLRGGGVTRGPRFARRPAEGFALEEPGDGKGDVRSPALQFFGIENLENRGDRVLRDVVPRKRGEAAPKRWRGGGKGGGSR